MSIYRNAAPEKQKEKRSSLLDYVTDALSSGVAKHLREAFEYAHSMILEDSIMVSSTKKITTFGGYDKLKLEIVSLRQELTDTKKLHREERDKALFLEAENKDLKSRLSKHEGQGIYQ